MFHAVFFIGNDCMKIHVFHTSENITFNMGIYLLKLRNEIFDLHSLGNTGAVCTAGSTGISELAGTLDKMQVVVISPRLDIILAYQIQRTDQLHTLEIGAVELRHHGLDLGAVEHAHEDGLDHIIIMMAQGDFVTAQLLREGVKMSAAHAGTEIARGFLDSVYRIENVGLENLNRNF